MPVEEMTMTADQESLLDDLLAAEDIGFTGWEIEFLDSLDGQRDRDLSEKQLTVLHRIARKAKLIE